MAIPLKYQAKEVLNKVLNAGEDALNVDLADSVSVTVDSEFPDAAAITDNFANPTTTSAMSMLMGYDGSAWDRVTIGGGTEATALRVTIASDSTGVVSVDDGGGALTVDGTVSVSGLLADGHNVTIDNSSGGSAVNIQDGGNTITVDGTVTANLSATDNAVLDTIDAVLDTIKTDTGTIDSDTNDTKNALNKMLYGTGLVIDYSGGDHSLGATYESLYVGVGGNIVVTLATSASDFTFVNVASGQMLPIQITHVKQSGTTATNMIAMKA